MEENKDKRTSGNDILREAAMEARREKRDVSPDETIVFRREPVTRQQRPQSGAAQSVPRSDLEHTAQIRGGAVIRPLKKQGGSVNPPAVQQRAGVSSSAQPSRPAEMPARAASSAVPHSQRADRPLQPSARNTASVTGAPARPAVQSRPADNRTPAPQTRATAPGSASAIKPIQPSAAKKPQTQPRRRTENDDFQIDEATYRKQPRIKNTDGAFTDSATSAVMSLVKAVVYIVAIIAVSIVLSVFVINTANDVFKFVVEEKVATVDIPEYATISDVADALYDAGAIKSKWAFKLWSNLKDSGAEFVAGSYDVSTTLNYDYLRATFKKSTRRVEVRVTIPEGYTVDEIVNLLVEKGIGTRDALIDVINNYDFDYEFIDLLEVKPERFYRLEGYLFPDTYNFYLDSTDEDNTSEITAIAKILDNFNKKFVAEYYGRASELGLTVDEAITLASIIEKETRYASELGSVSSVFHNRLKYSAQFPYINSDATIMYAIAHDTGSRLETMTGADTKYDSPYNTYTNKGLPPGPIANPGLNAIKYALYPSSTNYFYFVTDNSGRTLFATTDAEHQKNIAAVRAGA